MAEKGRLFTSLKKGYKGLKEDIGAQDESEIARKKKRFVWQNGKKQKD